MDLFNLIDDFIKIFDNKKDKKPKNYQDAEFTEINDENKTPKKNKKNSINNIFNTFVIVFVIMIIALLLSKSFYTVRDSEYAVITTFGKPSMVSTSGMHMKIPFIQKIRFVTKNIIGEAIGYDDITNESLEKESLMITLDYNFINADFYIEYSIIDPIKFLYNSGSPTEILENLAQSYIRDTVGLYKVDDVLTTGKAEIQNSIKSKLTKRLEKEDIGIQVVNVTIQDAEPPTEEIKNAFKSVETAKQGKETAINNANKYKNIHIPEANAKVDNIIKNAQAIKQERINEAKGQVARFNSLYAEYIKFPTVTKKRMFYEAMEDILPSLKVIINGDDNTNTILTPDGFLNNGLLNQNTNEINTDSGQNNASSQTGTNN